MALWSEVEAALEMGISVELLRKFTKVCPKAGQSRLLAVTDVGGIPHFQSDEVSAYATWLRQPWPKGTNQQRPHIPEYIKADVRQECHHACAICGLMESGEVAHIDPVADTLDNSPANLIILCPNHHTKYDYGYKPSSNVTRAEILAAKTIKRSSRQRMMRYEANAVVQLKHMVLLLKKIEAQAKESESDIRKVLIVETEALLRAIPELAVKAEATAAKDLKPGDPLAAIAQRAPKIASLAGPGAGNPTEARLRETARDVVAAVDDLLVDLDEVDCPHCGGRGQTGLIGDLCAYCRGSCVVTEAQAVAYDRDDIDEVDCPRCHGRGQTGLVGDLCAYCRGSCVVSAERAEEYNPDDIDEVDCPHCNGSGQTGLVGDLCAYCRGSCVVSEERAQKYNRDDIDEVDCPRCHGRGQTGLVGDLCAYCRGSCVVPEERAQKYNPDDIDEVDCPHCNGSGQTGLVGDTCGLCKSSQVVRRQVLQAYRERYGSR